MPKLTSRIVVKDTQYILATVNIETIRDASRFLKTTDKALTAIAKFLPDRSETKTLNLTIRPE